MATQARIGRRLRVETEYAGHTYVILYREGQENEAHQAVSNFRLPYLYDAQLRDDIGEMPWAEEPDDEYRPVWAVPPEPRPLPIDWKFFACVAFVAAVALVMKGNQ